MVTRPRLRYESSAIRATARSSSFRKRGRDLPLRHPTANPERCIPHRRDSFREPSTGANAERRDRAGDAAKRRVFESMDESGGHPES